MTQHYSSNTVSAAHYCGKCGRVTQHRIDSNRKGPCLACIEKLEREHNQKAAEPRQESLFQ